MIFAIPYQNERIAGHFSKAEAFIFTDKINSIARSNPALNNNSCNGKKSILTLLQEQQTDVVLIRNIGQKILAKLLNANIRVFRTSGRMSLDTLQLSELTELTDPSQGRPCKNNKQNCCKKTATIKPTVLKPLQKFNGQFTVLGVKQ
ncbi:NifB/NifX family molybdenum-iron cluster-binding protein [Aliivibrio sifiae]|uniref:Dinitrogenase iron-molybdenum cofactor biosynthesis domain-containing protein n=1 Tax=Aliivibrio sifiae TaxID=566293 RepID=A0A2S7XHY6_9GAMM|nr:NifB/NifX family molybdenum-iron cluster-binding protein [Aliivibrio sifiae]PQJ93320.1 hypothetical protein BTO23_04280 [Aliivibrio sifiae]GLR74604.1 hypothetical protein GCM10007855_14780 [Aliivibrio sifiae]